MGQREKQRAYRRTKAGQAARQRYRQSVKGMFAITAGNLFRSAKRRAKLNNLSFTITLRLLKRRLRPLKCKATGVPLKLTVPDGHADRNPFTPSLDRINPALGYTPRNCWIVAWGYNAAKSTGTHEATMEFLRQAGGR